MEAYYPSLGAYRTCFERRGHHRRPAQAEIWIDPGGTSLPIACTVLDISDGGAKILIEGEELAPDEFFLKIGSSTHRAKVVWQRQFKRLYVGVAFLSPDATGIL